MQIQAKDIAAILQGTVEGDENVIITGPGKIEEATTGQISFLSNPKYEAHIYNTKASAVLVSQDFEPTADIEATLIRVENVYVALSTLLERFGNRDHGMDGVSDMASVHPSAIVGKDSHIGAGAVVAANAVIGEGVVIYPQVYVGAGARIGDGTILYAGVKVMYDCVVGEECIIQPNAVIGSDGFGFSSEGANGYKKVPQIGNVIIEDHVEIGANSAIDRATMGSTIIREGVKLDNLIQVAHNVEIGKHTAIAAQSGISGSTKIGERALIGGQVGIVGHIQIADGTMIQAQSGIAASINEPNSKVYGTPAIDYRNYLKSYAYFRNLPDIVQRIRSLEKELDTLKNSDQ